MSAALDPGASAPDTPIRAPVPTAGEMAARGGSSSSRRFALQITLTYAIAGFLWIAFSDAAVDWLVPDRNVVALISLSKGWLYVALTAVLLYIVVRRQLARVQAAADQREAAAAALAASEGRLANALTMAHAGHWEYDLARDQFTFNDHFYAVMRTSVAREGGYTMARARYAERFLPPEEWPHLDAQIATARETTDPRFTRTIERAIVYGDGTPGTMAIRLFVQHGADGGTTKMFGISQDITERKQAERALRESQALYRSLVDHLPAGVFRKDAAGRFVFANDRFCGALGLAAEELLGRTAAKVAHELTTRADATMWQQIIDRFGRDVAHHESILRTGQAVEVDERLATARGEVRYFHELKTPVFGADGAVAGTQGVVFEITERKQAEAALQASEEWLQLASRVGGVGTFEHNHLTGETRASDLLREMTADGGDFRFEELADRMEPEERSAFLAAQEHAAAPAADGRFEFEYRVRQRDGTVGWRQLQARTWYGAERIARRPLRTVGTIVDISERKRAEAGLRTLSRAMEQSPVSILITDASGAIEYVNPRFTEVSGYTPAEVLRQNPRMLNSGRTPAAVYVELWRTIASGAEWHGEFCNRRKNGELFWEHASISPVVDGAGRVTHFVAVKEDITERRRMEEQLRRTQRLESLGMLASGIAHDLNNILAPIMMSAPLLRYGLPAAEQENILATIEASAKRGAGLVRQLLTFGRGVDGERRIFRLDTLIDELVKMARETFPRNIAIVAPPTTITWPVRGDATQLHQVLLNLCVNARDAMPEGGTLTIALEGRTFDAAAAARIPEAKAGRYLVARVSDTGVGIAPDILDKIFDPFFTTKETGQGTGLGLAMVMSIAKSHGGFVQVESTVGTGSTFEVFLPAATDDADETAPDEAGAPPSGHDELVLIVDDEATIRESLRSLLLQHGYHVLVAADGVDAVAQFAQRSRDIRALITDLDMPGMSGVKLIKIVRRLKPGLPVLVSSGVANQAFDSATDMELRSLGVAARLTKPYGPVPLLRAIHLALAATHA